MVIGIDGSRAFIKDRTGTENYSYQLILNLSKIDHTNRYIIYIRPDSKVEGNWPANFKFIKISLPRLWTQVGLAFKTFTDKLDILFVPAHTLPLIKRFGLKTIITVHDLGSEYLPAMHQIKQRLYLSIMQRYQLRKVSNIIAVSKSTKMDLVKKIGINPDKISVVYEGYDRALFKLVKNDVLISSLSQYDLKMRQYFLFVGTVQPRKNLTKLIQAFKQVCHPERSEGSPLNTSSSNKLRDSSLITQNNKLELVIAGSKGWLADEIYKLPKQLGIEERVRFLGYVPEEDLPALYSGAQALVFPSLFEGFGLPIIEAQASGCPVITSNISSMSEIAGPPAGGGAILVNPYKTEEITHAMIKIMDKRVRNKLIEAGLRNINRFSWENCAKDTLKLFKRI